ncbi:MAG: glycosyltransferase family 2 protein [Gammaproteobacteria bacterium]|nr:glycosyltransferase family 2 protein [Gammaproteobacteria bacterium]
MNRISVILITKNEAHDLPDCLASISWADEIIICDSGSTDATLEIARQYTPHVFSTDWPGFGPQKNRALSKATGEWVLSLDADERVSSELRDEIKSLLNRNDAADAYAIPRQSLYCGHKIRFGDWRGDRVTRLFRREKAQFTNVLVHESLQVNGTTCSVKSPLIHLAFKDFNEVLAKMDQYSSLGAQHQFAAGKSASFAKALIRSLWTFFRGYLLRLGFLDGKAGFQLAISNAEGCYYRYLKLSHLSKKRSASPG